MIDRSTFPSREIRSARFYMLSHDHVECAGCGERVTGSPERTCQPKGRGMWDLTCTCGITTRYDVEDDGLTWGQFGDGKVYCLSCGTTHHDRDDGASPPEDWRERFKQDRYRAPFPPVPVAGWDVESWARWITHHGEWL